MVLKVQLWSLSVLEVCPIHIFRENDTFVPSHSLIILNRRMKQKIEE